MANMPSLKCGKYAIFCVLNESEEYCNNKQNVTLEWIKSILKLNLIMNYNLFLAKQ
jgi:hypothetical protein